MASLLPTFEEIRKKNRENTLNTLNNLDVRTNQNRAQTTMSAAQGMFGLNRQNNANDNLSRSAVTSLRDNDDGDYRYFTNKAFKSVLGDNVDNASKLSYRNLVDSYNNASGDQQADIKKAISDEIITQRDYAKNGQQGSLKVIDYLNDLNSTLEKHGNTKGKSLLRQIGDYAATGGIVNTLGRGVSDLVNNIGGAIFGQEAGDKARANLEKMDNSRKDLGAVGVADTALATAANYGANLGTGGLWGLANAGIGGVNAVANTINDKTLAYDDNGNAIIRHKTDLEKAGELGNAALNAAFAIAGKKGIGPTLEATGKNAATGLAKLSAKDLAKYAVKELPWAAGTTYLQTGLGNLAQGKGWNDMDAGEMTKDFLLNLGQDVGMDAANYGTGKLAQRNAIKNGVIAQDTSGNLIKRDKNWNIDDVTNEDLTNIAKKAVSQNTLSNKALRNANKNVLLDKLAKNNDLRNQIIDNVDDTLTDRLNFSRRTDMANAIKNGVDNDMNGTYMRQKAFDDANSVRKAEGKTPYDSRQTKLYAERTGEYDSKSIKGHYLKHANELRDMEGVIDVMERSINGANSQAYPTKKNENTVFASETANQGYYPASTVIDKDLGILGITARDYDQIEKYKRQKSSLGSGTKSTITSTSDAAGFPFSGPQTTSRGSGGRSTSTILSSSEDDLAGAPISGRRASTASIPQNPKTVNPEQQEKFDNLRNMLAQKREIESNYNLKAEFGKYDPAESLDEIKSYHKKYGDDFYEKMPMALQEDYDTLLDMQSRDKKDVYTDPITGGKTIDENTTSKSKFAENTSTNKNFSAETRKALKSDPIGYKPTTNEERLARANQILGTKSIDEVDNYLRDNFFNVKDKERNSGDVVLAGELSKLLDAKGQYDRSTEIINKMSSIASKQGQDIQALSLMMNRSPEGIANMAQSAIKKGGGQMTGELRGEIVNKAQEIGKIRSKNAALSEENAEITEQIMAGKGDLSSLRKRQMEIMRENRLNTDAEARQFSQIDDIVSKNTPDNRSVFGSVYRASLLSGPRTHTGNLVSNITQNTLDAVTDRIASGIDLARSKITGKEREIVASAGGRKEGLKRGLKAAAEVMKTGDNLWDGMDANINKVNAWGQGGELEFKNKIANTMVAKPTNTVFRAMSAGDLPFRYTAFENAIRTEAKRQGVNLGYKGQMLQDYVNSRVAAPDPELQAYGIRKGNESVYDADTMLSKGMAAVDRVIDSIDNPVGKKAAKTAKTLIAPFVKVPSKVLSTAIDYSPLGSVKAIVNKVGTKGYTTGQFEKDLARSGFGSGALVGLGYALSSAGLLTGSYPSDEKERNRWKAEGIEPNSVKIGDKYLSLNYLGPLAMLTAMGAGVQQRQAKGEDAWSVAGGALMDTINSFTEQSYVQGLNNAVQAIKDSQRYGESYLNSLARGMVPNALRQTANAIDAKQRQVNNPADAVVSGIPGLSQTLDAKVDTYGREIENKQTLPLGQMWDALKLNNSRETNDVIDEVKRLHEIDANNDTLQVTPPAQDGSISVKGSNVKLTDAQKTQLQKDTGAAALKAMFEVMKSSEYATLDDEQKAKALSNAREDAQKQARKQFIEVNNITSENNPETTNSSGEVTGNYTNTAIQSATSNGERKNTIKISDNLSGEYKSILEKYNSMSSDDWNKYLYGNNPESAAAEYDLAKAKYENDLANGSLTDVQKIKRQKELDKLEVSQKWSKDVRDAYSLAGTKADIQELLSSLDDSAREQMVGKLNALNNAMYEAGAISKSTYNSRGRNINNLAGNSGSKKSGISSSEASALTNAIKALSSSTSGYDVKATSKPTNSTMKKSQLKTSVKKTYTPKQSTISVKKGK